RRPNDHSSSHQVRIPIPKRAGITSCLWRPGLAWTGSTSPTWLRLAECAGRRRLSGGVPFHMSWLGCGRLCELRGGCYCHHLRLPGYLLLDDQAPVYARGGGDEGEEDQM
ncbi:hypothetical protein LTR48_007450, partial [Friedmanniomyces endolithicus]